jgi:hypothetical protein
MPERMLVKVVRVLGIMEQSNPHLMAQNQLIMILEMGQF